MTHTLIIAALAPEKADASTTVTRAFALTCTVTAAALAAVLCPMGNALAKTTSMSDAFVLVSKGAPKRASAPRAAPPPSAFAARASAPVVTVSGTGPGQAGYVHYFVITGPDGEPESEVGIELPGDRIAWSFPELGVVASPFIASGTMSANGKSYEVEHQYGIRPFPDDTSMRAFQQQLAARVASWTEAKTPYCDEQGNTTQMCVSCLGFVLRVLYPGAGPLLPALPADFKSARKNMYTTEDLLFYLTGVPVDGPSRARLKRIERLTIPSTMREELVRISGEIDAARATASAKQNTPAAAVHKPVTTPAIVDLPKRVLQRRRS